MFVTPSANKEVRGRILPCFDFEVPLNSPRFKTAWVPYRDPSAVDPDNPENHAPWNQWYFPFEVYSYMGPNKRTFLSPKVRARLGLTDLAEEAHDPIARMCYLMQKDEKWKHLGHLCASTYNAPPGTPTPPLSRSRNLVFLNFYGSYGDREDHNFVLQLPEGGMDFIKGQLNKFKRSSAKTIDPDWPDYMFGDVTNPKTGLRAWSTQRPYFDKTVNTITFSKNDDSAADAEVLPVSDEVLAGRLNFFDETVMHIPTPQEVLDYVLDDGMVPLEFIKHAVGKYLNVPDAPTRKVEQPSSYRVPSDGGNKEPVAPGAKGKTAVKDVDEDDDIPFVYPETKVSVPDKSTSEAAPVALSSADIAALSSEPDAEEMYKTVMASLAALQAGKK